MIYYQFDPEMDREILDSIRNSSRFQITDADIPNEIKENEEVYVFSNDDEYSGFLWLYVHEEQSLEILFMYMTETNHTNRFQKKLLDFAVKRARFLKLTSIRFNRRDYDVECSQLKRELGCNEVEIGEQSIACIF